MSSSVSSNKAFYETEKLNIYSLNLLLKAAYTSERYKDVWVLIHALIDKRVDESSSLTQKELEMLSQAFTQIFGRIRLSLRSLTDDFIQLDDDGIFASTKQYIELIKYELHELCDEFIALSKDKLIPNATRSNNHHNLCIYYKLYANTYRYKCEKCLSKQQKERDIITANKLYSHSLKICKQYLTVNDYVYLASFLCFAVFQHDILKEYANAIQTLQSTFDAAIESNIDENNKDIELCLQIMRDNITIYKDDLQQETETSDLNDDDYNDGIDIMKYGKRVKATKHDPNNAQDMHDLKSDLKQLGLMAQNKNDPNNPMDEIRQDLHEIFMNIAGNDGIYKDVIDLILEYEAFIDLSKFKCIVCNLYFGCDIFDNLCSECFENKCGVIKRKEICKHYMDDIAIRIEWDDLIGNQRYYDMINMASLCSMKIMFRILNRNGFRGKWLDLMDENSLTMYSLERCDYFKIKDEDDEQLIKKRKLNERCITDFGVVALSAVLIRL